MEYCDPPKTSWILYKYIRSSPLIRLGGKMRVIVNRRVPILVPTISLLQYPVRLTNVTTNIIKNRFSSAKIF